MRMTILISLVVLMTLPLAASAELYSWKDASGKVHYADKPPLDKKIKPRDVKTTAVPGAAATAPATGEKNDGAKEPASESAANGKSPEQAKAEADARQSLCDNARKRLIQLESSRDILVTKNEKGESTPLVGEAKTAQTVAARKEVESWCK